MERGAKRMLVCEVAMEGEGDIEKETLRGKRGRTKETGIAREKDKENDECARGREREGEGER